MSTPYALPHTWLGRLASVTAARGRHGSVLARLLVLSALGSAGIISALGQAAPVPFDWGTVAGGAVSGIPVAAVLAWQLHQRERQIDEKDKRLDEKDEEIRQLHRDERALAERIAVQLAESTRALAEATHGMEATITRNQPNNDTLAKEIRRLQQLLQETQRRSGGGGGRQ